MKNHLFNLFKGILLSCFLLIYVTDATANTYYFSTSLGDDSRTATEAQKPGTPWKTLAKLNAWFINLNPGDSVLLKRGDIFYGSITIAKSGLSGDPIVISAYNIGEKPIITGFTTVSSWTNLGGGIYESSGAVSTLASCNVVTINDVVKGMGRYPNADAPNGGYLTIGSHVNNTSITGSSLPASFAGGEVVIRKNHWVLDRCAITSQSAGTINYTGGTSYYNPIDGFGYFIQNNINTLDQFGEWYFNPATKKLSVSFGLNTPSSFAVKSSTIDNLVNINGKSFISFDNLILSGANANCFNVQGGNNVIIQNCELKNSVSGVCNYPSAAGTMTVDNCDISWMNDYGIIITNSSNNTIKNNSITNIGDFAGAGSNGDGGNIAVWVGGSGNVVEYNHIDTVGFMGIRFDGGSNNTIRKNYVNNFLITKDDGGGIYTYEGGANATRSNNQILSNIVTNAIGVPAGTDAPTIIQAYGIYLDQNSNHVIISGNSVAYCTRYNIYFNDAHDIIFRDNTVYGSPTLFDMQSIATAGDAPVRNMVIKNNIWYVNKAYSSGKNFAMIWKNTVSQADLAAMFKNPGDCDSNYYCRPLNETTNPTNILQYGSGFTTQNYMLSQWKVNSYGFDAHAKGSPILITDPSLQRFEYNETNSTKTINLSPNSYIGVDGTSYSGTITLAPFSSIILIPSGTLNIGPVVSITSPSANATFDAPANIAINATASDTDGTVNKVEFYNGTVLLGGDNISPYSFSWNNVATGNYLITAKAYDNSGAFTISSPVAFSVSAPNIAPTVSITSPVSNEAFYAPAIIVLSASASDSDGMVSKVEFYNGNTLLGVDNVSPYSFNWNNVAAGNYSITAKAYDNSNLSTVSSSIVVLVSTPNMAPTVSITSPITNARFDAPATITLSATATDLDGSITKVDFYNGDILLGSDNKNPYSFIWNNVAPGNYLITAKATDNGSLVTSSSVVNISVSDPNMSPTVSITSPVTDSKFDAPAAITISATATDADGSVTNVDFYNGNTLLGSDNTSPYSFTWNNVSAGNYSITAKATDNGSLATTSSTVTVSVSNPNVAPAVSITSPVTNSTFDAPATITISATAADADGSITKVDFYNGNTLLGSDNTSPYSFTWNNVAAGNYSLTARATDNGSLVTTSATVTVPVSNPNVAPTVSITSPAANATFDAPATITISATAADADGSITKVDFYNGNTLLGSDNTSPYSFTWNNVSSGNYSLTAKATDNGSLATASATITVSVSNPNVAPTISTTSPITNATFDAPATITISATAADVDGSVTKVDFYNGNTLLGSDNTSPYSITWNNVSAGNYSITAKATDNGSLATTSATVTVSVSNPNVAPTVSITSPVTNSTFDAPATITISATAADADGSITKVDFYNGNTLLGSDNTSPYSFTWNNVAAGNYSITAKATDNGSLVSSSTAVTISVFNPNAAPTVSITSPATNTNFNAPASITFSATAADADGSVTKVDFYNGNTLLGSDNTSPYSFTWNNVAVGNYFLTAKATDNGSLATSSSAITISVFNPNVAPTISITSPVTNATFDASASITISATATDADGSITNVDFYNGNTLLGSDNTSPYSFTWNNISAGNYSLTAKATDNGSLATSSSAVTVSVSNPNVAPAVIITSPESNAVFKTPATITINANAADSDGSVSKVDFYNGSTLLGSDNTSPYSFIWENVATGNYVITAKATDNSGDVATSENVNIAIKENIAPTVSVTSPQIGKNITGPATIDISATASDIDGTIKKIEFYSDTTLLYIAYQVPYSYSWNNVPAGNYTVIAKATDNNDLSTISSSVLISVVKPVDTTPIVNTAPIVNIISPVSNSTYDSAQSISIDVEASDSDGIVTKVDFYNGNNLLGSDSLSPYTFTWKNVTPGTYYLHAKGYDNKNSAMTSAIVPVQVASPVAFAFTNFTGTANLKENLLSWSTTNCKNTSYFKVLRGQRRMSMKQIGKVQVVNSNLASLTYTFADSAPYSGTSYYKIAAIDKFGKVISSDIISVTTTTTMGKVGDFSANTLTGKSNWQDKIEDNIKDITIKVGPNPANSNLSIFIQGINKNKELKISILSINGILLKTINSSTSNSVVLMDVSSFRAGTYLVQAISGDKIVYKQFVKE